MAAVPSTIQTEAVLARERARDAHRLDLGLKHDRTVLAVCHAEHPPTSDR